MFFNSEGCLRNLLGLGKRYKNRCFVAWGCFVGAFGRRVVVLHGTSPVNISGKSPDCFYSFGFAQWEAFETVEPHHFPRPRKRAHVFEKCACSCASQVKHDHKLSSQMGSRRRVAGATSGKACVFLRNGRMFLAGLRVVCA